MFDLIDNYLIYEPEIKFLRSGNIYKIVAEDKRVGINSLSLSVFLSIKNSYEWKIFLRPMFSFSSIELRSIGIQKLKDGLNFKPPTENEIERQLVYQKCYKAHADIFNLKQVNLALYKI
jgi:hypothetical protein